MIATILLKALREQLKENDQKNIVEENAGPVPEIPLEYDQILKGGGQFWDDVNGGYLPEDLVLAPRRDDIERMGTILKVYAESSQCMNARMQA